MTNADSADADAAEPSVIVTRRVPPDLLAPLGSVPVLMPADDGSTLSRPEIMALAATAEGIITAGELRADDELLDAAPRLRIVANIARGYDNLDLAAMAGRGVIATNVPDAFTAPTAETALGLMLMVMRKLALAERFVRAGAWTSFEPGRWDGHSLTGKTLGLIGFGKIGQAVARRAVAFDMDVIIVQRRNGDLGGFSRVGLDDLLARSDIVSLHTPATPETFHLINQRTLARMKPGAVLINTARGPVVDESALVAALQCGHLGGAGLDVTEFEPAVPPALLAMDNVVVTPHLGGGTVESRRAARACAIANVAAVLRGEPPLTPISPDE